MGNVGTPPPNPYADPTPAQTAAQAAAIAGAQAGFRGTYGGERGQAYNDYIAMYNQQQAQVQAQQTYISAQENSRIQQDRQQAQSKYTQSTIRDARGNVVGYQPVDAQNPYYTNLTSEKTQKYANYNQKIDQYELQHGAIVGTSPTLYPVKTTDGKTVYAGVAGASFQQFQPTAQRDGQVAISGRAAERATVYSEPQRSVYWKPESQVQKEYARDVLLKQGYQASVISPALDKQYGADYVNKYATYYEGVRGRERAQATVTNQPSSVYMGEGLSNREVKNAKVVIDPSGGSFGIYQTRNAQPGFTPIYGFQVAGGSQGAAQSGMFGFAPTSPWVKNQWNESLSPVANATLAAEIQRNPKGFSRPGAEAYGGYVQPLDGRALGDAKMGKYPNDPWNFANFVDPLGANLPKDQMANTKVPWQITNFGAAPTLQGVDKEGKFSGIAIIPTPSQQGRSADFSPAYKGMDSQPSDITPVTTLKPATAPALVKPSEQLFAGMVATPLGTSLPAGNAPRTELPSTITKSEDWISGLPFGKEIGSLPVGRVVTAPLHVGSLLGFNPTPPEMATNVTLRDVQVANLPTSKVPDNSIGGLSFRNLAENLSSPVMQERIVTEEKSPLSVLAGGKEDFMWKAVPMNRLNEYDSIPWIPSKGVTYSGGSAQLTNLESYLGKQRSEIDTDQSNLYASAEGKYEVGVGWKGTEEERIAYNEKAAALSDKVNRYNAGLTEFEGLAKANPMFATPYDMSKTTVVTTKSTIIGDTAYGNAFSEIKSRIPSPTLVEALGNIAVTASGVERASPTAAKMGREAVGWGAGAYSLIRDKPSAALFAGATGFVSGLVFKTGLGVLAAGTSLAAKSSLPVLATAGKLASTPLAGYASEGVQLGIGLAVLGEAAQDIRSQPTARARGEKGMEYALGFASFGVGMGKGWTPDIKTESSRWYNPYAGGKGFGYKSAVAPDGAIVRKISYGEGTGQKYGTAYGESAGEYSISFGRRVSDGKIATITRRPGENPIGGDVPRITVRLGLDVYASEGMTSRVYKMPHSAPYTPPYVEPLNPPVGSKMTGSGYGSYSTLPKDYFGRSPKATASPTSTPEGYTQLPGGVAGTFTALPEGYFNMRRAHLASKQPPTGVVDITAGVAQNNMGAFSILPIRKGVTTGVLALPEPGATSLGRDYTYDIFARENYKDGQYLQELRTRGEVEYGNVKAQQWYDAGVALKAYNANPGARTQLAGANLELFSQNFRNTLAKIQSKQGKGVEYVAEVDMVSGEILSESVGDTNIVTTTPAREFATKYAGRKIAVVHTHEKGYSPELGREVTSELAFGQTDEAYVNAINNFGGEVGAMVLITDTTMKVKRPYQFSEPLAAYSSQAFEQEVNLAALRNADKTGDEFQIIAFREANENVAAKQGMLFYEIGKPPARRGGQQSFELYGVTRDSLVPAKRNTHKKPAPSAGKNTVLEMFDRPEGGEFFPEDTWGLMRKDVTSESMVTLYRGEDAPAVAGLPSRIPSWLVDNADPKLLGIQNARGRWFAESFDDALWYANDAGKGGVVKSVSVPKSIADQYRVSNFPFKEGSPRIYSASAAMAEKEIFLPRELADKATPVASVFKDGSGVLRKDVVNPVTFERIPTRRGAIVKVGGKYQTMPAIKPDLLLKVKGAPVGSVYEGSTVEIFAPKTKDQFFDKLDAYDRFHELTIKELRATDYTRGRAGVPTDADSASILSQTSIGDYHLYAFKGEELHILRGQDLGFLGTSTLQTQRASLDHLAATVGREGIGGNVLVPLAEQRFRDVYGFRQYEVQSANNPRTMQFYAGKVGATLDRRNPSDRIFIKDLYPSNLKKDVVKPQKKYDVEIKRPTEGLTILKGDYPSAGYTASHVKPLEIFVIKDTGHTIEHARSIPMERKAYETGAATRQEFIVEKLRDEVMYTEWNNPGARDMALYAVESWGEAPKANLLINRAADKSLGAILNYNVWEGEMSINNFGSKRGALRQSLGFGGETARTAIMLGKQEGAYQAILTPKDDRAQAFWEHMGFNEQPNDTMIMHFNTPGAKLARERQKELGDRALDRLVRSYRTQDSGTQTAIRRMVLGERPSVSQEKGHAPMGREFEQVVNLDTGKMDWRRRTNDAQVLEKNVITPEPKKHVTATMTTFDTLEATPDVIKQYPSAPTLKKLEASRGGKAPVWKTWSPNSPIRELSSGSDTTVIIATAPAGKLLGTTMVTYHQKGTPDQTPMGLIRGQETYLKGTDVARQMIKHVEITTLKKSGGQPVEMRIMSPNMDVRNHYKAMLGGEGGYKGFSGSRFLFKELTTENVLKKDTLREAARKRKNRDYPENVYKMHTQTVTTPKTEIVEFTPKYRKLPPIWENPTEQAFPMFPFTSYGGGVSGGGGGGGGSAAASASGARSLPAAKAKATQKITTYTESKVDSLVAVPVESSAVARARTTTKTMAQMAGTSRAKALAASEARARARMEADLAARSKEARASPTAVSTAIPKSSPKSYNKMLYDGSDQSGWETVIGGAVGAGVGATTKRGGVALSMPSGLAVSFAVPKSLSLAAEKPESLATSTSKATSLAEHVSRTKMLSLAGVTGLATARSMSKSLAGAGARNGVLSNTMPYIDAMSRTNPATRSVAKADSVASAISKVDSIAGVRDTMRPSRIEPRWEPKWERMPTPTPIGGGVPIIPPILGWMPGGGSAGGGGGRVGRGGAHREYIPIRSEFENYGMGTGGHKLKKRRR